MVIGTCSVRLEAEWVYSLKEKRTVVKSLIGKIKNKFNVSIAETDEQDTHRIIVVGFACVTNERAHADNIIQRVVNYMEGITDAVIINVETDILQL